MMRVAIIGATAAVAVTAFTPSQDPNMNGEYVLSKTPGAPADKSFPTNYKDYPGGVEYFDVYHGPITSLYSQVWWTSTANDIPDDIKQRFDGKVMAIVGMESDQVRKTPNGDVSVPITWAYNHHHDTAVVGKKSHLEKVHRSDKRMASVGKDYIRLSHDMAWIPVEDEPTESGAPSSAMFSDGNGGEYRKSMHVYAPPYVQLVESPVSFAGSPMQIDTWNRDKMPNESSPFVAGPLPAHSLAPENAPYSGLLECPLTTNIQKIYDSGNGGFNDTFDASIFKCATGSATNPQCKQTVNTSAACFAAVQDMAGFNTSLPTKTTADPTVPPGCSVAFSAGKPVAVVFNTNSKSNACCGSAEGIVGTTESLVTIDVSLAAEARITVTGPADVWFGVGFGSSQMPNTYAITVSGNDVTERKLGDHAAGTVLTSTVTVVSNTVTNNMRTVVLTRPLKGKTSDYYSFDTTALSLDLINAVGTGMQFAYHKASTAVTMSLGPATNGSVCICSLPAPVFGQSSGKIKYLPTGEEVGFSAGRCAEQPREDILAQRNPTCDLRTYVGGLSTCHHGWSLLDADQELPWKDQPLVYYKKFRIYFQEYNQSFHKEIQRTDWGIAADGDHAEYDVPQCAPGTPTEECTHLITGTWQPVPDKTDPRVLVAAHFHCHAPTCLKVELWNNDTGELLCRQEPIYGGTGQIDVKTFDEPGYIATPPCLWGSPEDGLEAPHKIGGVTIKVTALTNSTYGHHGEMALPEVSLAQP
eukprot:m.164130 g.164130  ORF g.164130 m.164130 type:complete len:753 (-) comp12385_c0_seq1:70-2328(-)